MATSEAPRKARKMIREFVMLVLGVLVALSADSWWADQQAQAEVDELLRLLVAELEENRAALVEEQTRRTDMLDANRTLLSLINDGTSLPANDSLTTLVFSTMYWSDPLLSFGAYEVLVSRGTANRVDPNLLARLAAHVNASRTGIPYDRDVQSQAVGRVTELVGEYGGFLSITSSQFRSSYSLPAPREDADFQSLIDDPDFANAAAVIYVLHFNYLHSWLQSRLAEVDEFLLELR